MKPQHKRGLDTKRLYRFEDIFFLGTKYAKSKPIKELRELAIKVWRDFAPLDPNKKVPKIIAGKGIKYSGRYLSYCTYDNTTIVLCRNQRDEYTLLHELTHALGCNYHDKKFATLYFTLLERFLGINKDMLTFAAQMHKVRV